MFNIADFINYSSNMFYYFFYCIIFIVILYLLGKLFTRVFFVPKLLKSLQQPKVSRLEINDSDIGMLQKLRKDNDRMCGIFHLLKMSIAPLLSRKYHIINIEELMKNEKDNHYMQVATWFVMWSESFGLQHLTEIQNKCKAFDVLEGVPVSIRFVESGSKIIVSVQTDSRNLIKELNDILNLTQEVAKGIKSAPNLNDIASQATEFLLEPCIIIQLPWNNVLLHQWLAAAMLEVLTFEKSSLELRHWPLPPESEPCARELLFLIKQLKDRIVLGFAIMAEQVIEYPNVLPHHPKWILDEVILPSLATLRFIITGKAYEILNIIKKISWNEENKTSTERIYINSDAHKMDHDLDFLNRSMYYHPLIWWGKKLNNPFPEELIGNVYNLKQIIDMINSTNNIPKQKSSQFKGPYLKPFAYGEYAIWLGIKRKLENEEKIDSEIVKNTLDTIKKLIIDKGILPEEKWFDIKTIFNTPKVKLLAGNIFENDDVKKENEELIMIFNVVYHELHKKLIGSEKEVSILARIFSMQIEILKQEQLIKMTSLLAKKLQVSPVAINLDKSPPLSVNYMLQVLEDVRKKRESQNQDWLWNQFPGEWRKPVNIRESALHLSLGTAAIMKRCEDRIGRVVYNVARTCFSKYEKGGEIFPDWQIVQYILPCYVAYLKWSIDNVSKEHNDGSDSEQNKENFCKLVHALIQNYENSFYTWEQGSIPREITQIQNVKFDKTLLEIFLSSSYYKNVTNLLLNTHIGTVLPISENSFRIEFIEEVMFELPKTILYNCNKTSENDEKYTFLNSWLLKTYQHMRDLQNASIIAFDFPSKNILEANNSLKEIYDVSNIMLCIEYTFSKCVVYTKLTENSIKLCDDVAAIQCKLYQWRYRLFVTLKDCTFNRNQLHILQLTEEGKTLFRECYKLIKHFRQWHGAVKLQAMNTIPDEPPVLKEAAICYLNRNFKALVKMLSFMMQPVPKEKKKLKDVIGNKCRNCYKVEKNPGQFRVCEECVDQNYPDVNFFCSKKCKTKRWKKEHMAEHLEFELGLSDFSYLNTAQ